MIRKAEKEDIEAISRIYVDAWQNVYRGIMPDDVLDCMTYEKQQKKWKDILDRGDEEIYVYIENHEIEGFSSGFFEDGDHAEIATLYFAEEARRKGGGTKLFTFMRHEFAKGREVRLWCVEENPYKKFYEHMGGKKGIEKTVKIGGKEIRGIQFVFERQ